jgi:hypothetical protein
MKKYKKYKIMLLFACMSMFAGCADYLDIIPDNVATLDNAFTNRINAERFLFGCYNFLPDPTDAYAHPSMVGGDEWWWNDDNASYKSYYNGAKVALGYQNANTPYLNFWDGENGGKNLFIGIRDCNIFLENIHLPPDLEEHERVRWIAEVKFLKAYFHFFLLQLYGPIPIIRENLPVNATPEEVRVHREPVDEVVNYIVELLDEAVKDLPMDVLAMRFTEGGRITKPIALAVKAKCLVWAASPLFNGNSDYTDFKDNRGVQLVPAGVPDLKKWERAATAVKNAIDTAHLAGHGLYEHTPTTPMSNTTLLKYNLRGAVTEMFNKEIVWPSTHDIDGVKTQKWCMPCLGQYVNMSDISELSATLKIAEQFYTNNGIPINEDPEWAAWLGGSLGNRYETQVARGTDHRYYIQTGETTAKLNFYREPRFYAYLGFDRGIFEGSGRTEANSYWLSGRATEANGYVQQDSHILTGYYIKKLVNTGSTQNNGQYYGKPYSFPIIRLTDLYLLYAEALNESLSNDNDIPPQAVYDYVDTVRVRAGLKGVKVSWLKSSNPNKPNSKIGMRDIIKQERLIELCFEGQRQYDLRRWKDAVKYLNEPIQGWNYKGFTADEYYRVTTYWDKREFNTKDYLWPLKISSLTVNSNLVQNPRW